MKPWAHNMFPRGYELVYDNYSALVFGFAPGERASEAAVCIAGYPKWVTLFFLQGATLPDPQGLLQGRGTQVRSIRLASPGQLRDPSIRALIKQAVAARKSAFAAAGPRQTVVKSVSVKQRTRRPAPAGTSLPRKARKAVRHNAT